MTTELIIQFPTIKQGSQPTLTFVWPLASGMTPTSFTGATLSATMRHTATGNVTAVTGTLTVTDAATRTIAWALSDLDSGTAGVYQVTFGAVIGGVPQYTLFGRIAFEINPTINTVTGPALVGIPTLDAAWVAAARAQVPDGDDVATRDGDGTAGELATIDASGNAVRAAGYVPGYWMQRTAVPAGETVTIPADHQMVVVGDFTVDGELIAIGDLVILD